MSSEKRTTQWPCGRSAQLREGLEAGGADGRKDGETGANTSAAAAQGRSPRLRVAVDGHFHPLPVLAQCALQRERHVARVRLGGRPLQRPQHARRLHRPVQQQALLVPLLAQRVVERRVVGVVAVQAEVRHRVVVHPDFVQLAPGHRGWRRERVNCRRWGRRAAPEPQASAAGCGCAQGGL